MARLTDSDLARLLEESVYWQYRVVVSGVPAKFQDERYVPFCLCPSPARTLCPSMHPGRLERLVSRSVQSSSEAKCLPALLLSGLFFPILSGV